MIVTGQNQFDFNVNPPSSEAVNYVISFNGRLGEVTLEAEDVVDALGFTPGVGTVVAADLAPYMLTATATVEFDNLQNEIDALAASAAILPIAQSDVTGLTAALTAKLDDTQAGTFGLTLLGSTALADAKTSLAYVKGDVGLGSVDNTADAAKNVLSATKLTTSRNINGVAFDGTGNITVNAVDATARVPDTRTISTTAPLTGGGDLSVNRTLAISAATSGAAGSMSAADKTKLDAISGTNTGDQTITLTGPVTGSGTGSFATTITAKAVTLAKMDDVATGTVFYRKTAGTGVPEIQALATLKTDLGLTGTNSGDQTITLTGDVTGTGIGSFAATVAANAITNAKAAQMATLTIKGNNTGSTANALDLTVAQVKAMLIPNVQSVASAATVTPTFTDDQVNITAQAAALALANPTGTAVPAKKIVIRIKDNGLARAITYDTQYRAIGVTLPTTTVINKTFYLGCVWNSNDTKLDVIGVVQEA